MSRHLKVLNICLIEKVHNFFTIVEYGNANYSDTDNDDRSTKQLNEFAVQP